MPRTGALGVPGAAAAAASHSALAEPWGRMARTAIGIARKRVKNCFRKIIVALPHRRRRDGVLLEALGMTKQG